MAALRLSRQVRRWNMLGFTPCLPLNGAGARLDAEAVAAAEGFPTLQSALAACAAPAADSGGHAHPRARMFAADQVPFSREMRAIWKHL